jgi:hypothetical protein
MPPSPHPPQGNTHPTQTGVHTNPPPPPTQQNNKQNNNQTTKQPNKETNTHTHTNKQTQVRFRTQQEALSRSYANDNIKPSRYARNLRLQILKVRCRTFYI